MSISPFVTLLRQAMTTADAAFPKKVAKVLSDSDIVNAKAATVAVATNQEISDRIVECLLAGIDPLDDNEVRRLTTSRHLGGESGYHLAHAVQQATERRVVAALAEATDAVVEALAAGVDREGQRLAESHKVLGDADLNDTQSILNQGGPTASRAWADAKEAVQRIRMIEKGWVALANLTRFAPDHGNTLRLAELSLEQYEQLGRTAGPWDIVRAGIPLSLADRVTIRSRADRINLEREEREARHNAAFSQGFRRARGIGSAAA